LLGLPEDEVRSWLPAKGDLTSGEFTYLDRLQNPEPAARREDFAEQRMPKRNPLETLLKIAAVLVLIFAGSYAYIIWNNLGRLQGGGTAEGVEAAQSAIPIPGPFPQLESTADPILETPFQLVPLDSPTPFLEQDALALDLQIAVDPAMAPAGTQGEGNFTGTDIAQEPEVRAALPVDADPATDDEPPETDP
jgi:hypothetical protein